MKLGKSMALILVLTLGSIGVAQDLATDVGKGAKDVGKATEKPVKMLLTARKTLPKTPLMPPTKQPKIRRGAQKR